MARMPDVGEIIDDVFRIDAQLDSGNFGTIYKAHDLLENRAIALKVLKLGTHDEAELRQRFEREALLAYNLRHPHIVTIHYYGQTSSGLPYFAMEYLEGIDLHTLLRRRGALHPALARRIAYETLLALEAAHEVGVVHRDLKPANIFLVNDGGKGFVKVLDFGFAKAMDSQGHQPDITRAGMLVGTPAYMAPELVHKKDVGTGADIYALGLILAEMLHGKKLVEIDTVYDTLIFQASSKNIKLPRTLRRSPMRSIIRRATQKDIAKRYDNAREMMEELEALTEKYDEFPSLMVNSLHDGSRSERDDDITTMDRAFPAGHLSTQHRSAQHKHPLTTESVVRSELNGNSWGSRHSGHHNRRLKEAVIGISVGMVCLTLVLLGLRFFEVI